MSSLQHHQQHAWLPWGAASTVLPHRALAAACHLHHHRAQQPSPRLRQANAQAPLQPLQAPLLQWQQQPHVPWAALRAAAAPPAASSQATTVTTQDAASGGGGGSSSSSSSSSNSAGPGPPGLGGGGRGEDEFSLNHGEAVLVLREDLPQLFERDMRYHIFRDDITFRTPAMTYLTGKWKYVLLHRAVRLLGNLLYSDVHVSMSRMWQPAHNKMQLRVRWSVCGRPRLSFAVDERSLATEVISTYSFDSRGKIYEHQVDQLIPPEAPLAKLLEWLVARLGQQVVPQPQLPIPGGLRDVCGGGPGG